uniref:Uncharacterized protein n=1 Tax=Amphimedon queenslandica TaxID=400682 RepID=A0A1X7VRJ4_AMPQE
MCMTNSPLHPLLNLPVAQCATLPYHRLRLDTHSSTTVSPHYGNSLLPVDITISIKKCMSL